ncbi:MAG: hypothetical protein AAF629_13035 [Chloroflexota bacterium]
MTKKTDNKPRFYDNRKQYLLFVTTCSEKWAIAERVGLELAHITPSPPAMRMFDVGMGDATVITRVMREFHARHPTIPLLVVAKEISMEDVRLGLEKMADRFYEHPNTVLVITNLKYREAPGLKPRNKPLKRWEIALKGQTAHDFDTQIRALQPIIKEGWETYPSPKTGNPLYVNPSALVIYRADSKFVLDPIIPPDTGIPPDYDLIICAQPYRAKTPASQKVKQVLAPMARSIAPGGRMIVIQSTGYDPGMEIIRKIWPQENPFQTPRHDLIETLKTELATELPNLTYSGYTDKNALFKYNLHALPDEFGSNIGTSTLLAAWNAASYVAQIDEARLDQAVNENTYLDATRKVLQHHGGLWFMNESFILCRGTN